MDDFQTAFNDADIVMVDAGLCRRRTADRGRRREALAEGLRARGHRMVKTVADAADLAASLRDVAAPGDLIICMGAGDITKWAAGLATGIDAARAAK